MRKRVSVLGVGLAALIVVSASLSSTAFAARKATGAERKTISSVVNKYLKTNAKDGRVSTVTLSTKDGHYGVARLASKKSGDSLAFLERKDGKWKVVEFGAKFGRPDLGSGGFDCDDAPAAVFKDLFDETYTCSQYDPNPIQDFST